MKFIKTDTDVNLFENIIETESQVVTHQIGRASCRERV